MFSSVTEVVSSKLMPRILSVVSSQTQSSDKKSSIVFPEELLIVKKIGKTMLRRSFLKVYSYTTKEDKTLLVSSQ